MADTYTQVKDITVSITTSAVIGSVGLGYPLVIQGAAEKEVEYTECNDLTEVVKAGFTTDSEVYKACAAIFAQANKPKTVAVVATTGKTNDWLIEFKEKEFRQIVPILGGETDCDETDLVKAVSTMEDKMLFLAFSALEEMPTINSDRVVAVMFGKADYANAAVVGASAGLTPGSFTYKNLILTGVEPVEMNSATVDTIHEKGAICILKKAGDIVTSEGKTTSGEYIDVIDSKDYIINNIVYKCQKLLNDSPKLSFDNVGISQLENTVTSVLADAYNMGIIATNDDGTAAYSTTFAPRAETSASDRASRTYNGGNFTFDLAGAIHYAHIKGQIVI